MGRRTLLCALYLVLGCCLMTASGFGDDEHDKEKITPIRPPSVELNDTEKGQLKEFLKAFYPLSDEKRGAGEKTDLDLYLEEIQKDDVLAAKALGELNGSIYNSQKKPIGDADGNLSYKDPSDDKKEVQLTCTGTMVIICNRLKGTAFYDANQNKWKDTPTLKEEFKTAYAAARQDKMKASEEFEKLSGDLAKAKTKEERDKVIGEMASKEVNGKKLNFTPDVMNRFRESAHTQAYVKKGDDNYVKRNAQAMDATAIVANGNVWNVMIGKDGQPQGIFLGELAKRDTEGLKQAQWATRAQVAEGTPFKESRPAYPADAVDFAKVPKEKKFAAQPEGKTEDKKFKFAEFVAPARTETGGGGGGTDTKAELVAKFKAIPDAVKTAKCNDCHGGTIPNGDHSKVPFDALKGEFKPEMAFLNPVLDSKFDKTKAAGKLKDLDDSIINWAREVAKELKFKK